MIEILRMEDKYLDGLKKLMKLENLNFEKISLCLDTTFVIIEKKEILGFGYYNAYKINNINKTFIDHLYVKKSERMFKLGDSLFRAILNSLTIHGSSAVYMRKDDLYLEFLKAEEIDLIDNEYIIKLPDFFERKCRGSKIKEVNFS